jgi:YD repeat-containing protein
LLTGGANRRLIASPLTQHAFANEDMAMKLKSTMRNSLLLLFGWSALVSPCRADEVSYVYDELDRLIRAEYSDGAVIEYRYDANGNRVGQTVAPANLPPVADAGPNRTVRLGSLVTLNGSASADPDSGPQALTFAWSPTAGSGVNLNGPATVNPSFTPTAKGDYFFDLAVFDGAAQSPPARVKIAVPALGDIDLDSDVDYDDLNLILAVRNKPADGPNDLRDLDGNMKIDGLDTRKFAKLPCTRPRCATQ